MIHVLYFNNLWLRFTTWWAARTDGLAGLPVVGATALGYSEERIVATTETSRWHRVRRFNDIVAPTCRARASTAKELAALEAQWTEISRVTGRTETLKHFSRIWFWLAGFVICGAEAMLNAVAFNSFTSTPVESYAMAGGLGLGLCICAEFLGTKVRQWPVSASVWSHVSRALKCSTVLGIVAWALYYIQTLRMRYLVESGAVSAAGSNVDLALYAVNAAIFAGAVLLAYMSIDPVEGFVETKLAYQRAERALALLDGDIARERAALVADLGLGVHLAHQLIFMYRRTNRMYREQGTDVPRYFDDDRVPHHRPAFSLLEWAVEPGLVQATLVDHGMRAELADAPAHSTVLALRAAK